MLRSGVQRRQGIWAVGKSERNSAATARVADLKARSDAAAYLAEVSAKRIEATDATLAIVRLACQCRIA
jgi:hypothetical protein